MNIVLISPYDVITSQSVRILAAVARSKGHLVHTVFLMDRSREKDWGKGFENLYSESLVADVVRLSQTVDLVGMSIMTMFAERARQVAGAIRQAGGPPVLIGGIHATASPEECAEFADYVCIGEGEETLLELLDVLNHNGDPLSIRNLAAKRNGKFIRNPLRPLIRDLNQLPVPEYHFDHDRVVSRDGLHLAPLTENELYYNIERDASGPGRRAYHIYTARGCPYHCAFCANSFLKDLYPGWQKVRRRSDDHLFRELHYAVDTLGANYIMFDDDTMISRPQGDLFNLATRYKNEIGKPFHIEAAPAAITEERIRVLVDAGLERVAVGIQSGSNRALTRYQRTWGSPEVVLKAGQVLAGFADRIITMYDVILDDPENSLDDELETLRLLSRIPRPYHLQLFSLTYYPGAVLQPPPEKREAKLETAKRKHYHQKAYTYINLLYSLSWRRIPLPVLRTLMWKPLVRVLNARCFELPLRWAYQAVRVMKGS